MQIGTYLIEGEYRRISESGGKEATVCVELFLENNTQILTPRLSLTVAKCMRQSSERVCLRVMQSSARKTTPFQNAWFLGFGVQTTLPDPPTKCRRYPERELYVFLRI
jgi:hypothetical protein